MTKTKPMTEEGLKWEKCQLCGHETIDGTIDHIIPRCWGGSSTDKRNQQILCVKCHRIKTNVEQMINNASGHTITFNNDLKETKPMTDEWHEKLTGLDFIYKITTAEEMILREFIQAVIDQATSKAREERTEEIRTKLVEFAIDGGKQPDELKGLDLYSKMLSYLKSLIQKDK